MALSKRTLEDIAIKLKLEASLDKTMRSFFRVVASDAKVYYKNTQQIIDAKNFDIELNGILRQHYRKTAKAFDSHLRQTLSKMYLFLETKALDDLIQQALMGYFRRRSIEQTNYISQTNMNELYYAFQTTVMDASKEGKILSKNDIADQASNLFEARALARARTIGLTETQNAAESTKNIEAITISDNDVIAGGVVLRPENVTKTWSTILDDRTRVEHALADDQTVDQEEPFIVGGEKLMFPGDDSMGASLENIINCRCNTERAVQLSELPSFVNQPENQAPTYGTVYYP